MFYISNRYIHVNATDSELNDHFQEKSIIFALSQSAYGACLFLGYWGYLLLSQKFRVSYLFPFRYSYFVVINISTRMLHDIFLSFSLPKEDTVN